MAILTRNVTGHDILEIREFIAENGPTTEEDILKVFFPGDETDPYSSDQLKPLQDAIEFLRETNQIIESDEGYRMHEDATPFPSPRLAVLNGIRTQIGEDCAYNDAMELMADNSGVLFDRYGTFLDELNDNYPDQNWNDSKIRYWSRVMETIGFTKIVNHTRGGDADTLLAPKRHLMLQLLVDCSDNGQNQLATVLALVDDKYIPAWKGGRVPAYIEQSLITLDETDELDLRHLSDMGQSIKLGDRTVNTIEVSQVGR